MTPTRRRPSHAPEGAAQHRAWLDLIEVSGPFLALPVLRSAWPTLDALEKPTREALRREHARWRDDPSVGRDAWVHWVLTGLLGWGAELRQESGDLDAVAMDVAEHETRVEPTFALVESGEDVKPATTRLLGLALDAGQSPTARVPGSAWAATPVDRVAALCRHHGVELGLVTDGRWWALVWAPRDKATGVAVFDAIAWPEAAERDVVRAFLSLLVRSRFFAVRDDETLPALLQASLGSQEDITEALGSQVRQAVELLVAALGREDLAARERGAPSLEKVEAHEVYRGAVSVMMRIVFLLFAEERRLLPADNDLYRTAYSAGTLLATLEERVSEGSEDDLEHTAVAWHRLLALFTAVHDGIEHPRLMMHAHDGSLFDPTEYPWLDLPVDDRTVLHMLKAVQTVEIGSGRLKERRTLSFRSLGVEEIGYVYEGLLAYDAFRAADVVLGLVGKRGQEAEVELRELESFAPLHGSNVDTLAADITRRYANHGMGSAPAVAKKLKPLTGAAAEDARRKLLAAAQGDAVLADRLTPFFGILRQDLRELPLVIQPGALYVTDSPRRRNTGTHYTPRELAEEVVLHALQPLVYEPGPLQTADEGEWKLKTAAQILELNVADIAMGSAAFLVAAARYLGARLIEAWTREGDERAQAYTVSDVQSDEDPVVIDARRTVIEHCLYGVDINPMAVEMAKLSLWLVSMDPVRPFTFLDDRLVAGDSLLGITSLEQLEQMRLDLPGPECKPEEADLFEWAGGVRSLVAEVADERARLADIPVSATPMAVLKEKRARLYEAWSKVDQLELFADLLVGAYLYDLRRKSSLARSRAAPRGIDDPDPGSSAPLLEATRLASEVARGGSERQAHETAKRWLELGDDHSLGRGRPLHWPLVFSDVSARGGFDAIVGNPPFLGGPKLTPVLGHDYREYLASIVAQGVRATNVDLVAYFALRPKRLLSTKGQIGLLATNTLAQGDTRIVGISQLISSGFQIYRALKSRPWPSKNVALEYCAVWLSRGLGASALRVLDGSIVSEITSSLEAGSRTVGEPMRLAASRSRAFVGHHVNGLGFVLTEPDARALAARGGLDTSEVLQKYLNGHDVSSRPDMSASRMIINFHDWTLEEAKSFPDLLEHLRLYVRPERERKNRESHRKYWWRYADYRRGMEQAIASLSHVIVMTVVSKTVIPVMVPTGQVFADRLVIFADDDPALLAFLSSSCTTGGLVSTAQP